MKPRHPHLIRIFRTIVLASALAVPATASLARPPVEAAFGNTVVSTFPDGRTQHLWLEPDGSYSAKGRRGQDSSGHWTVRGDQVCLQQLRPFPAPIVYCTPVPHDAATATWSSKAVNGQAIKLRMTPGRPSHP